MTSFLSNEDFLLSTPTGARLFHSYAEGLPIVDYHCHISPAEIWRDATYPTITDVWLGGDHYKWRLMRACGFDERLVTGNADPRDKFQAWAETLERSVGNPVYEWSHLELRRFFGYDGVLSARTAQEVWDLANACLATPEFSCRNLVRRSNVRLICTTDDPADDLEYHRLLAAEPDLGFAVVPAMRPDAALAPDRPGFGAYVARLADAAGMAVETFADFKAALSRRFDFFAEMGCRASDHALDYVVNVDASDVELERIFADGLAGRPLSAHDLAVYKTAFMRFAAAEYVRLDWAMQIHFGCRRDNNSLMFAKLGPDTGFDCIRNGQSAADLAGFLDSVNRTSGLPKTILYSLDPNDSWMIDTVMGCFQQGPVAGKLQNGSAWWFNDNEFGMRAQMTALANEGVFGTFVGMLTDSRSFLSYPRHEYFRRVMCGLLGEWVEQGKYPCDDQALASIVADVSYNNAIRYFGFALPEEG